MTVVVTRDKDSKSNLSTAGSLTAARFLMNKFGLSAPEALAKLGLAKLQDMPLSFRKGLRNRSGLPHNKELSLGNEKIAAPNKFEASAALSNAKIAELCRFVSSHPKFEIRYKTDLKSGYSTGSGCVECNEGFTLRVHKEAGVDLLIPLEKVQLLFLNKL